jgi:hypothetical protein
MNDVVALGIVVTKAVLVHRADRRRHRVQHGDDLLGLSRFEVQERFFRLDVPLRLGPATLEEARAEVASALKLD